MQRKRPAITTRPIGSNLWTSRHSCIYRTAIRAGGGRCACLHSLNSRPCAYLHLPSNALPPYSTPSLSYRSSPDQLITFTPQPKADCAASHSVHYICGTAVSEIVCHPSSRVYASLTTSKVLCSTALLTHLLAGTLTASLFELISQLKHYPELLPASPCKIIR